MVATALADLKVIQPLKRPFSPTENLHSTKAIMIVFVSIEGLYHWRLSTFRPFRKREVPNKGSYTVLSKEKGKPVQQVAFTE